MTTMFFLVRHGSHGLLDRVLCGRMPGVHLGDEGLAQARRAAERLARERIAAVQTSPLERARETAAPISDTLGVKPEVHEALNEVDLGEWTGRDFAVLRDDPRWAAWNNARAVARAPGGENMIEVQARIVRHLEQVRGAYSDRAVVLVSHGDVIRSALLYCLGMPIDAYRLFEVSPASISAFVTGDWGMKVLSMNEVPA